MAKPKTPHKRILLRLPIAFARILPKVSKKFGMTQNQTLVYLIEAGLVLHAGLVVDSFFGEKNETKQRV